MDGVLSPFQIRRTDKATRDEILDSDYTWTLKSEKGHPDFPDQKVSVAKGRKKTPGKVPGYFDYWQMANLIDYWQIYATTEKPAWRKELEERFGPIGIKKPGYLDLAEMYLWEWDESELGELTFDSDLTLTFDGSYFYVKKPNRAGRMAKFSIALESWLENRLRQVLMNIKVKSFL